MTTTDKKPRARAARVPAQVVEVQSEVAEVRSAALQAAVQRALEVGMQAAEEEQPPQQTATQLKLPLFNDAHVLPNAFLRSALFPGGEAKKPRPFVEKMPVFAVGDLRVTFTGQQFDQGDLDVLSGILEIGSSVGLGNEFRFSVYELLRKLDKPTGGKQYQWVHDTLIRLNGGTVEIRGKRGLFFGSFIEGGFGDSVAREYTVRVNPRLGVLFGLDMWSQVDREQRKALSRNTTAKALHCYYSSHADPGAHRYDTLAKVAGLRGKQKADVKRTVVKAHEALIDPKCGFLESYEAGAETISVKKAAQTTSQRRHLARKSMRRSRRISK